MGRGGCAGVARRRRGCCGASEIYGWGFRVGRHSGEKNPAQRPYPGDQRVGVDVSVVRAVRRAEEPQASLLIRFLHAHGGNVDG
jgi:hypothetical protein